MAREVLRPRRRGPAAGLDRHGDAHPQDARPEGARRAAWCRTTPNEALQPRRPAAEPLGVGPDFAGAKDLAAFKAKIRNGLAEVKVEHVEPSGLVRTRRRSGHARPAAYVALDGLTPDDVEVQLVHGRVHDTDELRTCSCPAALVESYDGRPAPVRGLEQPLPRTGSFGYSVRVAARAPAARRDRPSWDWHATPDACRVEEHRTRRVRATSAV